MQKKILAMLLMFSVLLTLAACGGRTGGEEQVKESSGSSRTQEPEEVPDESRTEESRSGGSSSGTEESSAPEGTQGGEPVELPGDADAYFASERCLPAPVVSPQKAKAAYYYFADAEEGGPGPLCVYTKADKSTAVVSEMECVGVVFDAENLYVLDAEYNLWGMRVPDGELEQIASLGRPVLHRFWEVYGGELAVFRGDGGLVGVYLPTGEVRELGPYPLALEDPAGMFCPVSLTMLTNRSYLWQLPQQTEEAQLAFEGCFVYDGAGGKVYRVLSGQDRVLGQYPAEAEDIAAFFPLDENGVFLPGGNFEEVSLEEAGL